MRTIIADTGPLYAAFDPSDQYHNRVQEQMQRIEEEDLSVIIIYSTVLEAYSLVLQRFGVELALVFLQQLLEAAELINPSLKDYLEAIEKVNRYPDQKISLFDAVTAVTAERLNLAVWTYDYHFDVMCIPVWR